MAVKFINVKQEGTFEYNNRKYFIEIEKKSTADLHNIYLSKDNKKSTLISSVFTRYLSGAKGVKKAGAFKREVYGDYEIYRTFIKVSEELRRAEDKDIVKDRKMLMSEDGFFVDVLEKQGEHLKITQTFLEGNLIEERLQELHEETSKVKTEIKYELRAKGSVVKVNKLKGLGYILRDSGASDITSGNLKTLDMIGIDKDLSWLDSKKYMVIQTTEKFLAYLEDLKATKKIVGFDTETTGLRINRFKVGHSQRDRLVGVCLSVEDDVGVYIPIGHTSFENLDEDFVIEQLRPFICNKGIYKKDLVTHNGLFDWKVMHTYGIDLNIVHDTYILMYLLNNSQFRKGKDLTTVAKDVLGVSLVDFDDIFIKTRGRKINKSFAQVTYDLVKAYGPADADIPRLILQKKLPELPSSMEFLYWVEIELMKNIALMEYDGMRVDVPLAMEYKEEAFRKREELEQEIYALVGRKFNINSTKELPDVMYKELGYPVLHLTDKGNPSTGVRALEMLSEELDKKGNKKYPLAELLKKYKAEEKLINGFLNKIITENIDGYIFPSYNQTGTDSGRISCSQPNLQQTPGDQRRIMIPDSDEYYFVIADYSQVEYKIMSALGGEDGLIESFQSPLADHHTNMYARMYNKHPDEVTSTERGIGKTLNFALTYGMGPRSLAIQLFNDTSDESINKARELSDRYWDSVPNIRDMLTEAKDRAFMYGYIETYFGRRRYFPDIRSEENYIRATEMRRAANTKIQGTGADIIKIAHVKVQRDIDRLNLPITIKLSMHDELALQVHKSVNPWTVIKLLRDNMELEIDGFPPLFIGANVGNSWDAGQRDDLEVPVLLTDQMFAQGEHLKSGVADPEKEVEYLIKDYMLDQLRSLLGEQNLTTLDKALENVKVLKILKDYFGGFEREEVIQNLLDGKGIDFATGKVVYNENKIKFAEDTENEETEVLDINAVRRYHVEDKDRLILDSPEINNALRLYKTDYRVMIHDRKCFVRIEGCNKQVVVALRDYFDQVGENKGHQVVLVNEGYHYETEFKLNNVDKLAIMMILDDHTLARKVN